MHDDKPLSEIERELCAASAGGPPSALRGRVLAGVSAELRAARADRRRLRTAVATLVLGVAGNWWIAKPVPPEAPHRATLASREQISDVTAAIAEATDEATGRWFEARLLAALETPAHRNRQGK